MNDFNIKQFLVENKMTRNSRLLKENISKFEDYISGMFDMSVSEKEGSQTGVWKKEEYASDAYEGTDFSDLSTYLGSVGGKATLEGNPDITVKLLDSGDIKWSAYVTLDEDLNEEAEPMEPTKGTGLESDEHTFKIKYKNTPVDIDAEETLILALLKNDESAIQYLRSYIKDIQLV